MESFQTLDAGRCQVHTLLHPAFRTKELSLRFHLRMARNRVTEVAMLPAVWMNGTRSLPSYRQIALATDHLYGTHIRASISKRGGYHIVEVGASVPDVPGEDEAALVDRALDLVLSLALDHAIGAGGFAEAAVQREKELHRRRIRAVRDDKAAYALQRCHQIVCRGRPAGLPRLGFEEDVEALLPDRLYEVYQQVLAQAEVHAYAVGQFRDMAGLAARVADRLAKALPTKPAMRADEVDRDVVLPAELRDFEEVTEAEDAQQTQFDLAFASGVGFGDDEYPALVMMNGVFGGFAHSKLFMSIRERRSLAYSVWSFVDAATGLLTVYAGISADKRDEVRQILEAELEALRRGEIEASEWQETRATLRNQYQQMLDQPAMLIAWHHHAVIAGRDRTIPEMIESVDQVRPEDAAALATALRPVCLYVLEGRGSRT
ncbi:EF-P 5-aminopentanol modification-associated protein YfmF [Alicyclobacillus acidocaldarius]|uniref:Peptidase M16 domain protein n=1 Tax=Alicyclobacillus acidocaldarius (strain Tc-4-1) TaxID=1048834 RepID=F8IG16_ALIAT|nr:insulinase family protein [Alicyclobacillus acidocaldarius]AEJ42987.1 peptidase M16 domain protein [Alicyclobacillus acidocaldarius subsp. acidocaldarius Tc-4-1]